jgi:hypothetical protein
MFWVVILDDCRIAIDIINAVITASRSGGKQSCYNLHVGQHMLDAATVIGVSNTMKRRRLRLAGQQRDG